MSSFPHQATSVTGPPISGQSKPTESRPVIPLSGGLIPHSPPNGRLGSVFNALPSILLRCRNDRDWTAREIRGDIVELTGYASEDLTAGRIHYNDLIHPNDRQDVWNRVQEAMRDPGHYSITYRIQRKDGTVRRVWEWGRGVIGANGEVEEIHCFIQDISSLGNGEMEAETRTEAEHRRLVETSPCVICRLAPDGTTRSVNGYVTELTGFTPEELAGRNWWNVFHSGHLRRAAKEAMSRLAESDVHDMELDLHTRHGQLRTISWNSVNQWDDQGRLAEIVLIGMDVTLRRHAREALQHSAAQFRVLIEKCADPLIVLDADGCLCYESPALGRALGYRSGELAGANIFDLVHADDREPLREAICHLLAHPEMVTHRTHRIRHRDGAWRHFHSMARVTRLGDVMRVIVNSRDVTEQVQAEQAMQESEQRLRSLIEQLPGAVYAVRLDEERSISYVSPAIEEMTGHKAREFHEDPSLGQRIVHPDDQARTAVLFDQAFFTTAPFEIEYRIIRTDGQVRWFRNKGRLIQDEQGRPSHIQGFITDVTDLHETHRREAEVQARFQSVFDQSAVGISLSAENGKLVETNAFLQKMLGYSAEELASLSFMDLTFPDDALAGLQRVRDLRAGRFDSYEVTKRYIRADGKIIWVHVTMSAVRIPGQASYSIALLRDVTDKYEAQEQLQRLQMAIDQSPDWITISDSDHRFEYVNSSVERLTGRPRDQLIGRAALPFLGDDRDAEVEQLLQTLKDGNSHRALLKRRTRDGQRVYLDRTVTPVRDGRGRITHYISTAKDITHEKQLEDRLQRLANYDALTGLPNRELFVDRVGQVLSRSGHAERLAAVLILEMNRFKFVNDAHGTAAGDTVLRQVASRLQGALREGDTVARLDSDEFAVCLADVARSSDVIHVLQKLRKRLTAPYQIAAQPVVVTASIGAAIYPGDGVTARELIQNADVSLGHARRKGRNNYEFYTPTMNATAGELVALENRLYGAAERGEFDLDFQPCFDIATGRCVAMEALLRWRHPELGMVPPTRFIPVLEESGAIVEVGEHALRMAARRIRDWHDQGLAPVPVSVNLSPVQLARGDVVEAVSRAVREFNIDPAILALEITESAFMSDDEGARQTLAELRSLGLRICIDDFGTGYSSLRFLRQFPVDSIKIDMSFIRDMPDSSDDVSIVTAIVSMAHQLGLTAVAEGVEKEAQLEVLRLLRCDVAQGYHLGRPAPADAAGRLLEHRGPGSTRPSAN